MAKPNPLADLIAHWGLKRVAKRFEVSTATVSKWRSKGLPEKRRREVLATSRRVEQALERAALNDDWAREVLTRWVEAGNAESDAMARLRELKIRGRKNARDLAYIATWEGLLAQDREERRLIGKQLNTKRFRNTPTGRQVGDLRVEIERYRDGYEAAIKRDNAREISNAWKLWERQVARLLENLEDLQIPGMSKRQVYTLFFSP